MTFHAFNRVVEGNTLFEHADDYAAFRAVLCEALGAYSVDVFTYVLMPTHWHFVLQPEGDDDLAAFMRWMTLTHARRWRNFRGTTGRGAVYQGRYRAIPVQCDAHFLRVCRYVERNPVRAGLVERAELWPWSAAFRATPETVSIVPLIDWPVPKPSCWTEMLNEPESRRDVLSVREHIRRERPFGDKRWQGEMYQRLNWRFGR